MAVTARGDLCVTKCPCRQMARISIWWIKLEQLCSDSCFSMTRRVFSLFGFSTTAPSVQKQIYSHLTSNRGVLRPTLEPKPSTCKFSLFSRTMGKSTEEKHMTRETAAKEERGWYTVIWWKCLWSKDTQKHGKGSRRGDWVGASNTRFAVTAAALGIWSTSNSEDETFRLILFGLDFVVEYLKWVWFQLCSRCATSPDHTALNFPGPYPTPSSEVRSWSSRRRIVKSIVTFVRKLSQCSSAIFTSPFFSMNEMFLPTVSRYFYGRGRSKNHRDYWPQLLPPFSKLGRQTNQTSEQSCRSLPNFTTLFSNQQMNGACDCQMQNEGLKMEVS